jgi:4-amino-4-deoxy-L-arabinose transferase-like glycosyltransferase
MKRHTTATLMAAAIVIVGAILYTTSLDHVPPYLIHDEAGGALQAHAIATTAHDLSGRLLPLYFTEPEFPPGRDPLMIYVTALALQVLPFSEAGVRTPTAWLAVLDFVLIFFAARALFKSTAGGVLAALLLMLTPVHFIRSRLLLSPLYSVPFILAWLWSLARFAEQPTTRRLMHACIWLGLGMYSYLAAVVMMPLYLLMTLAIAARPLRWRGIAAAVALMAICLVPMATWYLLHPERNAQIVTVYELRAVPYQSWSESVSTAIGKRMHLYWSFFDPGYLLLSGDASMINSTRTAGLFPFAFALLLPIGMLALIRSRDRLQWIIAGGFLAAPLVSVISGAIEMNRVMFAIPFAVLVATRGVMALWERRALLPKAIASLLVASIVAQFAVFHRTYMSDAYREASATWFSGNVREAVRELIARSGDSRIYISQDIEWVHRFWRFYAINAGRADLIDRATYFRELPADFAADAKVLCPSESPRCMALGASSAWRNVVTVPSIGGNHRYVIFERAPANNKAD